MVIYQVCSISERLIIKYFQVFLLESQLSVTSPRSESDLDDDDNRSYIFVLSPVDEKKKDDKIR